MKLKPSASDEDRQYLVQNREVEVNDFVSTWESEGVTFSYDGD